MRIIHVELFDKTAEYFELDITTLKLFEAVESLVKPHSDGRFLPENRWNPATHWYLLKVP